MSLQLLAGPAHAARFGVPTNLNAAGQVCTAVGTPAGCTAVSADPPGWFVLERLDSGSANGDVVKQLRLFIEVTGTTLDLRVFDAGLSDARDLGRPVDFRYRLLNPDGTSRGAITINVDNVDTDNRLVRFACQEGAAPSFETLDTPFSATHRIWGSATGNCAPLARGLYIFEVTVQGSTGAATFEGRNAFGIEALDASGNPYAAYTIGNADDTLNPPSATDTSMITGGVAGDRPTANVSGYSAFFPYVNRGCTVEASNFDLDANNAEGNGSVAWLTDTLGASTNLARSNNDGVASSTVNVEPTGAGNLDATNYGMFTLYTQLDEWATAQNHVDWRVADFLGSTAGTPANYPRHPTAPIRTYLPNGYSACATSGCTLVAPAEPVLAASAVLLSGENPPLPGGATTRFALTATVANLTGAAITNVQVTVPIAPGATYVAASQTATLDGVPAACTDASAAGYRRCTFASVGAGQYASLAIQVDFDPPANGIQNLTGAPAAGGPPPNTTVWAQYTPAFSSATYARSETLGPLCQMAVNAAAAVDMSVVTLTDSPDPVTAGTNLTYAIRVRNQSGSAAPLPSVTDVLPAGTTFVSVAAPAGWTCLTPGVGLSGSVRCSAATLAVGTNQDFTLVVRVASTVANGTILTDTATVASGGADSNAANNSVSTTTTVVAPAANADLSVTLTDAPDPVPAGQDLTYAITVANVGPATALSVVLNDVVPTNTTFRSVSTQAGWTCSTPAVGATGTVSCSLASLALGQSSVLTLRVRVNAATTAGTLITDTATVSSAVNDPVAGNNSATTTATVLASTTCPTPGSGGAGGTLAGVVNTYYPGTGTAAAGATSITLGTSRGAAATIAVGDLVLVVQMQDALIDSTNTDAYGDGTAGDGEARGATALNSSGLYEYAVAASAVPAGGGTLTVTRGLVNSYTTAAATGGPPAQGQRRFQVIRVPQYSSATLGSTLSASYWNGATGAILAFDVQNALALGGATVDVSGRGFRGGGGRALAGGGGGTAADYVRASTNNYHGSKGEGVVGTPRYVYDPLGLTVVNTGAEGYPNGSYARGAPGNAGGGGTDSDPAANDENSGGGGGGNGGLGGRGGNAWNSNASVGGFGGAAFAATPARLTLGGGGGAGTRNNSPTIPDASSGNAGGGIVMIRAGSLTGTGTITADGLSANTADATPENDGGGGGGAGGSVLVYVAGTGLGGLTVNARGGRGSDAWPQINPTDYPGERHGPGGGGGGGRVFLSAAPLAANVDGGSAGITSQDPEVFGASDGSAGTVATDLVSTGIPGIDTTGVCSPLSTTVADMAVSVTGPPDSIAACSTTSYTFTVANNGPDQALNASASFPIPTNTTFQSLVAAAGWTCATPPIGGTGAVSCARPSFPAAASSVFTLSLRVNCGTPVGTLISVGGTVGTSSTDTYAPNNTTSMANLVGPPIQILTRASIRGVRVDRSGLVEFATSWQQRTAGFHLYQTDDPSGRRGLLPLTAELVPAPRPDSNLPLAYSVPTAPVTAAYLVIEERERGGRGRFMGPFEVGDPRQQARFERTLARLGRVGARPAALANGAQAWVVPHRVRGERATARLTQPRPLALVPTAVKLETEGEGLATVRRADLLAFGLPPGVPLSACRLDSAGSRVPFTVRDEGSPDESLVFHAAPLDTAYTTHRVHVLSWTVVPRRMAVPLTSESDPFRPGWLRVAKPLLWVAGVPRGSDPWLWDQLLPGSGTWPYSWDPTAGTFDLPGWPAGTPVSVRLRFQGMTEHRHVVSASVNGESLGEVRFDGIHSGYLEATASSLRALGNELQLNYAAEDGDASAYAYIDYLEVQLPGTRVEPAVVVTLQAFDDSLPSPGAQYLIVTHRSFASQAERLATAKRAEGLSVAVADVEAAYDRYSGGVPEAAAVRELLRRAAAGGALRYVLLFGDDSFDPDDRAGQGGRSFVPSLYGWDGVFGRVASENRYADLDGDGRPDVAIGRLPASTVAQAEALVTKVEQQQALLRPGFGRSLFAVDNKGADGFDFAAQARTVASRLTAPSVFADLTQGVTAARAQLFASLAQGAAFTHYFGHGGPQEWADEGLLTVDDAASLPSTGTVVLTWACEAQFFQYLFGPSVNESLVLKANGGAVAAFGPAGITDAPLQAILADRLYDELLRGRVALGEAIRRAKARALAEDPRVAPVVEGWNLLGDPSLVVTLSGPRRPALPRPQPGPGFVTNAEGR